MKPILVQQKSNGTLWWAIDYKIAIRTPLQWDWATKIHRVYTLIPIDPMQGGSRICHADNYTFLSN